MKRILSTIKEEGFECLPCDRINLDFERFAEYRDSDEHPAEAVFERPIPPTSNKKKINEVTPSILRYFLDGSRRTYKVADIIINGRYLPLIAGQIGVAVVKRCDSGIGVEPLREFCCFKNVLTFPNITNSEDLIHLQNKINKQQGVSFSLLEYGVKAGHDPVDLGIAKIMSEMHDLEIAAVRKMTEQHLLGNDRLLIVDGPLRFKKKFDIVQFRNVIGLSKTFRPSFTVGKGRRKQDVGSITSGLKLGERTSAFKTIEEDKTIGMWYLRIRQHTIMANPLQGIVKMECYAVEQEDKESGFDSERIDIISGHILRERNVTPYKADLRWASHIYPVYMAESYLKASFMSDTIMSDTMFKSLF